MSTSFVKYDPKEYMSVHKERGSKSKSQLTLSAHASAEKEVFIPLD